MVGCIIGAGVLGIPYVVSQAGFLVGLIDLLVLGIIVMFLYLYFGEVVLRTHGRHQLTGYAERYLGKWGKRGMLFSMVFGVYGALIAYLLGVGSSLAALFGGSPLFYSLIFFAVVATIMYLGIDAVGESELFMAVLVLIIVGGIFIITIPHVTIQNLSGFNISKIFLPYGVILFAYMGIVAVPETHELLIHHGAQLKRAILVGTLIPIIVYIIFTFVVVGAVSPDSFASLAPNDRVATIALHSVMGKTAFVFANLFAIFAMSTSFIGIGFSLKEMFMYDYHLNKTLAWVLTCSVPLVIVLMGLTNFIEAIAISGTFAGGLESSLVVLMISRAKKCGDREPEYTVPYHPLVGFAMILIFVAGAGYLLWDMF